MTETPTGRAPLRRIAPLAAAGCAALVATLVVGRRRSLVRRAVDEDPPDLHLATDAMEAIATDEGMPEAPEA